MKPVLLTLAAVSALLIPLSGSAQQVLADIRVESGPVSGHILVGHPPIYRSRAVIAVGPRYYRPHHGYRVVVIHRGHRGHGWYRRHGYRYMRVWYDPQYDTYYGRDDGRRGLRAVVVYERGGRYYRDGWDDRDDNGYRGRDRDRRYHD